MEQLQIPGAPAPDVAPDVKRDDGLPSINVPVAAQYLKRVAAECAEHDCNASDVLALALLNECWAMRRDFDSLADAVEAISSGGLAGIVGAAMGGSR